MEEKIKKLLEQSKFVQELPDNEKKLVMQNAQDIASDLLKTEMEDLDAFVKEKYPDARILQGEVYLDNMKLGKVTDLYAEDAVNNYLEGVKNERFLKSSGIENDPNITESNVLNAEDKKPRGGPRKYPSKYTWEVTENGLEVIEVRKSQFGDYRKFKSTNKGVSYFGTVDTPLFDSIEEANKNRPEVMETKLRQKKKAGGPRKYPSKYGYIVNADNKLELKELRFFEASGQRKAGYRVSEFYPSGQIKQGKMYQGQIFDSVQEAENNFKKPFSTTPEISGSLDDISKQIIANEAGLKTFDQLINEFEGEFLKGLSPEDAESFANWYLDSGFDKEGKARAWLNENTDRLSDPAMIDDDTSFAMEQQGFDEVAETNKAFELEQQQIDADELIDNIPDDIVIDTPNAPLKGNQLKQILKNRLKKLAIGGLNYLDMYELGLIGYAVAEPAAQKLLEPIMPYIIPGYKPPQDNESYKDQVIANLQETAKISPTAKLVEKMPEKVEYEKLDNLGYGWLGKMLDR